MPLKNVTVSSAFPPSIVPFYDPELLIGVDCISRQEYAANSLKCQSYVKQRQCLLIFIAKRIRSARFRAPIRSITQAR
jgi:hypothetical protein